MSLSIILQCFICVYVLYSVVVLGIEITERSSVATYL